MKIPETTANVGAYYGNEENGQWQPNGVILDSGVGGGVVGSGDAGVHRPPVYPLHIRGHVPPPAGYVMAGAYYPPAAFPAVPPAPAQDDFADYMWMENEEEFDKQVMQQLEEEALMEQCIEAMLEDEQRERQQRPVANGHNHHYPTTSNGASSLSLEETVSRSTLNPLAAEFVPTRARQPPAPTDDRQDPPEVHADENTQKTEASRAEADASTPETSAEQSEQNRTEEVSTEPPEVSAADVQPIIEKSQDKRPKEVKKDTKSNPVKVETKKITKTDVKTKAKPQPVKSETKVQPKRKEIKSVKSETKSEERVDEPALTATEVPKPAQSPIDTNPGFKPVNYAAAAKANKPKKPSPPPATEKPSAPIAKPDKIKMVEKVEKKPVKSEKPVVQRKNSTK